MTQSWLDVAFVHWAAAPADVAGLMPPGVRPDTFGGVTYVGLVAFRVRGATVGGLPGVPYLGTFPETNVRLYSVDARGRRGVVFLSMDASRLVPVGIARAAVGLPYFWSRMAIRPRGDVVTYASIRRWPGPRGAHSRFEVRIGERVDRPSDLELFLTARWGLHKPAPGGAAYIPNTHRPWPLHHATLLTCDQTLTAAASLPPPDAEPVSVLYSPGVRTAFGRPVPVRA